MREATTASGVDNAALPRLANTAERDYFTLKRGWSLCKNNWKEPRSILMSSADRVAHIDGQLMQLLLSNTRASSGYKYLKSIKPTKSLTNVCLGFCFNIFLRRHKFWLHRQFSSAQFQKRRNDGWWFPLDCYCTGLFWTVNVCWAHPVISRASYWWQLAFSWCYSRCFWSSQNHWQKIKQALNNELKFHIVNIY